MTAWATDAELREAWADAPSEARLAQLSAVGQEVLERYAPTLAVDADIPRRYVEALALYCRDLWGAMARDGDMLVGDAEFAVKVRPISDAVRALLRPRNPRPRFGRRPTA